MTIVRAQEGEPVEVLIRKFNKKVLADGVLNELKKESFTKNLQLYVNVRKKKEHD